MSSNIKNYIKELISSESTASSKRAVTLGAAAHFFLTSFAASIFLFCLMLIVPKGAVNLDLLNFVGDIIYYDFLIILVGLGFVTAEGVVSMMIEKMKIKAAANIATGTPTTDTINVDTVNVDQNIKEPLKDI